VSADRASPVVTSAADRLEEEARTRHALLHILEDLQRERDAIQQAKRQWLDTVDAVRDPMMVHDGELRIVRANRAYAERAGMTFQELIDRPYWQCFPRRAEPLDGCRDCVARGGPKPGMMVADEEFTLESGEIFVSHAYMLEGSAGDRGLAMHLFEDVTEARRAQALVTASERRFRTLIENASDLLAVLDRDGTIAYMSPSITRLGDYRPDEVIGRHYLEFAHPEDVPTARAGLAEILAGPGRSHASEVRFRHKDGHWVTLESISRNALEEPAVCGIVINSRDITERKRSEDAVRASEQRFRSLFSNMLEGFARLEPVSGLNGQTDFVYVEVNPAFERLTGLRDVIGRKITDVVPGIRESNPELMALYERMAAGGAPERVEAYVGPLEIWFSVMAYPSMPNGFIAVFDNITERKRAEGAVRLSEQRLSLATQSARMGIWDWDVVGDKLVWDAQMYELYGIRRQDFGGAYEAWKAGVHPDDVRAGEAAVADALAGRKDFDHEFRVVWPNGEVRHLEGQAIVQRAGDGAPVRMIGVNRDVTDRNRAEVAIVRANRALRTLSAGNEALVRASEERALLAEMCRVVVDIGGYNAAIAGYARDEKKSVEPMAFRGIGADTVARLDLSWDETEAGRGIVGTAIRTGAIQVSRDTSADPRLSRWRELLAAAGIRSALAVPLQIGADRPIGVLYIGSPEPGAFDAEEVRLLAELAGDLAFGIATLRSAVAQQRAEAGLRRSLVATVEAMAATVEARDPYTAGHQRRVAELAAAIAREMGLPAEKVEGIRFGALIHDLGKIQVPAEILSKPTRLTKIEFDLIKQHPQAGYDILKGIDFPWPVAQMVHQHHERLDGSGYPQGLKGDAIALEARVLAVADVVEAMSSHRPYRPGLGIEAALKEIEAKRGVWFDAAAADACLRLFREKGYKLPD
jgi:PAS domain S-box-containing protein/putative nucleotidyltransferase with HDIG domain